VVRPIPPKSGKMVHFGPSIGLSFKPS
jgi:hypothetical protein